MLYFWSLPTFWISSPKAESGSQGLVANVPDPDDDGLALIVGCLVSSDYQDILAVDICLASHKLLRLFAGVLHHWVLPDYFGAPDQPEKKTPTPRPIATNTMTAIATQVIKPI